MKNVYKILSVLLIFLLMGVGIGEVADAKEVSKKYEDYIINKYKYLRYVPNKFNPQNLTYSIEGVSKKNRMYKEIKNAVNEWNRSPYIQIKLVNKKYAKVNNHIFIKYVGYYPNFNDRRGADVTSTNKIRLYKNITYCSNKQIKTVVMHEIGHTLGFGENRVDGKYNIMNPNVSPNAYITKKQFEGLKFRYATKTGRNMFDVYNGSLRTNIPGDLNNWTYNIYYWHTH